MLPYLKPGQLVLARQWFTKPKEGQIVIIQHNGLDKIKRIKEFKADKIYVVGDNPKQSTDSRDFGWLPRETIIAKVLASL
jgi:phage repressor protein C with HTH and peptisase S24 domain